MRRRTSARPVADPMTPEISEAPELAFRFEDAGLPERQPAATIDPAAAGRRPSSAPEAVRRPVVEALPWMDVVGSVVAQLSAEPEVGPGQLLALVVRGVEARGGAVVDADGRCDAAVRTAWGRITSRETHRALARCRDLGRRYDSDQPLAGRFGLGPDRTEWAAAVGEVRPDGVTRWLILFGAMAEVARDPRPLRTLLQLLQLRLDATDGRPRKGAAIRRAATDGRGVLLLPEGHLRGRSPGMETLYRDLAAIAPLDDAVLITGETGVGKEHVARILALNSSRNRPFVAINCAAIPEQLLEAEMFGIGDRVATGVAGRRGRFAEARGGTLFLDEIGEMDPRLQAKLLRAIDLRRVQTVGGAEEAVDVRIVAATNVDLHRQIGNGAFRADLFYRLARYELSVPPLRQRIEDLPALLERFVVEAVQRAGKRVRGLTVGTLDLLSLYPWPGNVRELENEAHRLVHACPDGGLIDAGMLSPRIRGERSVERVVAAAEERGAARVTLKDRLWEIERRLVLTALRGSRGNQSRAARRLGVHRNTLAVKIKRLQILEEEIGC